MASYPYALSELQIGDVTLPNRIVRTAHVTMLGVDANNGVSERLIQYHEARARGGVGLSILEICSGHISSPAPLMAINPAIIEGYQELVERVKPHGMKLFQQAWHGGHHAQPIDGSAPWSASDVPSPRLGVAARPMSQSMIEEAIASYVLVAKTAKAGGLDGIEVHGSHGYLPQQFLSPNTNKRTDDYGGPLENRMRFLIEILTAVRNEVGGGFPIGVRVGPDYVEGGFGVEECVELVRVLEERNLVNFVDVSQGSYFNIAKIIGAMHEPTGYQLDDSTQITDVAKTPTIVTGRFRTLEEADQVIRLGQADCVSMVRATIADPDLVRKTIDGEPADVRPCIACNQSCIGNQLSGKVQLGCTVNPAVGRESKSSEEAIAPAESRRRILVVGGGPAGMEAARITALRGHAVTLCEADKNLGGKLNLAKRTPYRASIGDIAAWLENEIYKLGVDVRLNTYVDRSEIGSFDPSAVICATGSWPRHDGFHLGHPGRPLAEGNHRFLTSFDIFSQPPKPEDGPFVVDDDVGHYEAIAVAEHLLENGAEVTYVTRHTSLAPLMEPALSAQPAYERLSAHENFKLITRSAISRIEGDDVSIAPVNSPEASSEIKARGAVLVSHDGPNYELFEHCRENGIEAHIIGDAKSPRFLETAIKEGRMAGMSV